MRDVGRRAGRRPPGEVRSQANRRYHRLPDAAAFARFQAAGWKLVDDDVYEELLGAYRRELTPRSSPVRAVAS